jgi:hypothetical protein
MKRSSASISDVCCSVGSTASPAPCGAVRSCPGSDVSAAPWDTAFAAASARPHIPATVSASVHTPRDSRHGHRKKPASAGPRASDDMWPEGVWGDGCGSSLSHAAGVSPVVRTRRRPPLAHSSQGCGHTCGSVFFRLEGRVVALLPGLCTPELDLLLVDNGPKGLDGDASDDAFLDNIVAELGQRPAGEWLPKQYRRTQSGLDDEADVIFSELSGSAGPWGRLNGLEAPLVEILDDGSDMLLGEVESPGDIWYPETLVGGKDDLCTPHPDAALAGAKDALKDPTFSHIDVSNIQTHMTPPCVTKGSLTTCVCSYNTIFGIAQVLN